MKFDKTGPRFKLIQEILDKSCIHLMVSDIIWEQQLMYIFQRLKKDKQAFLKKKGWIYKVQTGQKLCYVWLKVSKKVKEYWIKTLLN